MVGRRDRQPDLVDALRRELASTIAQSSANASELVRLRAALDALPIGVVFADANGDVQVSNRTAGTFTGHAKFLVSEALEHVLRAAAVGKPGVEVVEFFGPPRRTVEIEAVPLESGGALATIEDVSERTRLDSVRTDFVANISHELKTPIGGMVVLAETLCASLDDLPDDVGGQMESARTFAARIEAEALRASQTIDDLLELSRIELGGLIHSEPIDVDRLIDGAIDRSTVAAEHRSISIRRPVSSGLTVWGDARQLGSALNNLLDNAIKYSDDGGGVTVTATSEESAERNVVCLSVADDGAGIPAVDIDRIFERFYRVDRARTRQTGGTGLGLSIVRHVATNHGGEVSVTSHEGEGSTFTLRLPAREV